MEQLTDIWYQYQQGLDYLQSKNYYSKVESCYKMVNGDQWHGLQAGNERPAQLNVLAPIMKSATALVGQNSMTIYYSPLNFGKERKAMMEVCSKLNNHASSTWERLKLDKYLWDILQDSFISGDSYTYFYEHQGQICMDLVDNTSIMLGDEQNPNLQEQPYILLIQRRYVAEVKKDAERYGLDPQLLDLIVADNDTTGQINGGREVRNDTKLISVLKLWKEEGEVYVARSVRNVVYQPKTKIKGLSLYPLVGYSWKPEKGSARGLGDIWDKIPNQISINKNLYRFESAVKSSAFPHKIYQEGALSPEDVQKLSYPDSNIAVRDLNGQGIDGLISYIQPAHISGYASSIWQDVLYLTRQLSGSGDNIENVDPEKASGAAITAARDAKLLNVNMQMAAYKQFIEDIAILWYDMWLAYNPNGLPVVAIDKNGEEQVEIICPDLLKELKLRVKVDVAPNNTYSKLAQEAGLKELFAAGHLTFEEYIETLDDDSSMPKAKLLGLLENRAKLQKEQQKTIASTATATALVENNDNIDNNDNNDNNENATQEEILGELSRIRVEKQKLIAVLEFLGQNDPALIEKIKGGVSDESLLSASND